MTVGADVKNVYYTVKNIEATFEQLIEKSTDEEMKKVFIDANHIVSEVKDRLHKQVQFIVNEEPQY